MHSPTPPESAKVELRGAAPSPRAPVDRKFQNFYVEGVDDKLPGK